MSKKISYTTIWLFGIALVYLQKLIAGISSADIQVKSSNEAHFIFEYSPPAPKFTDCMMGEEICTSVQVNNCGSFYEPGSPVLPCRTLSIGVPGSGTVDVQVIEIQTFEQQIDKILPATKISLIGEHKPIEQNASRDGIIDSSDTFFPQSHLSVIGESWFRHQKIVEIEIFPILYNPVSNRLRICKKLAVKIEFKAQPSGEKQTDRSSDHMFESAYSHKILNYPLAKKWRQASPKIVYKPGKELAGSWFKIAIERDDLYKLDYSAFANAGYDSTSLNPVNVQMFYGGGRELSQDITAARPPFLEISTDFFDANGDGRLGKNDYLCFFGQSTSGWADDPQIQSKSHYINHYTNENIFWVYVGNDRRKAMFVKNANFNYATTPEIIDSYRDRIFQEEEIRNNEKSGVEWVWDWLQGTTSRDHKFELTGFLADKPATLKARIQGVTEYHHDVSFYLNGQLAQNIDLPFTLSKIISMDATGFLTNGQNSLRVFLRSDAMKNEIFFDWYELEYGRRLRTPNQILDFNSSNYEGVVQFNLEGFPAAGAWVFDVTDPFGVIKFENLFPVAENVIAFRDSLKSGSERRYVAATLAQIESVSLLPAPGPFAARLRSTENSADYVIIIHNSLLGSEIQQFAKHRQNHSYSPDETPPKVKIVTTEEIYDEFSGGLFDPTAIRDFLKYAYENWSTAPSYVLLVGDACFDFKNNSGGAPPTLVPTHEDGLRASDDWFVCLDGDRVMDMFMGRLPVATPAELQIVVDKIINYDIAIPSGPWKNRLLLIADDSYSPTYVHDDFVFGRDTELLATSSVTSGYDLNKIFLYQYPKDDFGKKPAVNQKFFQAINQGALYVNFLGHGNHEVLTHESIFYAPDDISLLTNGRRLPLFFAGTCAVGYFDYDRKKCLAEQLLLEPGGGCIAVVGASRWNVHAITFIINQGFYQSVLDQNTPTTLGQALVEAKLQCRYPDHRELPILFGDPAQRLSVPDYSVNLFVSPDSIALTRKVQIKGEIQSGQKILTDFSGKIFVKFYDAMLKYRTIDYSCLMPGRVLFSDTFQVQQGKFAADFFLRADTAVGGASCKLLAYAWADQAGTNRLSNDAAGYLDSLFVFPDTLAATAHIDSVAPEIEVFINEIQLATEHPAQITVSPNFAFSAWVRDTDSGINLCDRPEYKMRICLDNDPEINYDLSASFIFDQNSNHSGSVTFNLMNVAPGLHQLVFAVWDNSLNSASVALPIYVEPEKFRISNALVYPNPAPGTTTFTFSLSHDAEVTIKVYTIAGRLINKFQTFAPRGFNRFPDQGWECTDRENDLLANGVYLYKIIARQIRSSFQGQEEPQQAEVIERLVVMR